MAYAVTILSGSTDGKPIAVVAVATLGTTIHTAFASATLHDIIELEVTNVDVVERPLTLEVGGVAVGNQQVFNIPAGETIALGTFLLRNSLVLTAFSNSANKLNIRGKVMRQS